MNELDEKLEQMVPQNWYLHSLIYGNKTWTCVLKHEQLDMCVRRTGLAASEAILRAVNAINVKQQ